MKHTTHKSEWKWIKTTYISLTWTKVDISKLPSENDFERFSECMSNDSFFAWIWFNISELEMAYFFFASLNLFSYSVLLVFNSNFKVFASFSKKFNSVSYIWYLFVVIRKAVEGSSGLFGSSQWCQKEEEEEGQRGSFIRI